MDLLSNILSSIAFDALSIADFQLQAPWGIHTDGFESGFSLFVTEGSAWVGAKGQARRRLDQGHSVIAPRGTYLEYASSPTAAVSPLQDVWGEPRITALETRQPASFDVQIWGGSGVPCRLLGFAFNLNETAQEKIVGSLPDVMFLEGDTSRVDNLAKSFADILSFKDENYLPGGIRAPGQNCRRDYRRATSRICFTSRFPKRLACWIETPTNHPRTGFDSQRLCRRVDGRPTCQSQRYEPVSFCIEVH